MASRTAPRRTEPGTRAKTRPSCCASPRESARIEVRAVREILASSPRLTARHPGNDVASPGRKTVPGSEPGEACRIEFTQAIEQRLTPWLWR